VGRPALPIGTFGQIKTYPTKTGYRPRCLYRDYDGKVRSVEKAGRTKAARSPPSSWPYGIVLGS